jgi:hypothetical protein
VGLLRRPPCPHLLTSSASPAPPVAPAELPHEEALRRALFLTSGNARELRSFASGLLLPEPTLGLSRGYQAAAAVRRAYNLAQV